MGNRPISVIGTAWDNTNRNAMEQNRKDTKQGLDELAAKDTELQGSISTAQTTANNAMNKANEAKTKADSVQNQLDDLVIESGNSNAEVVQMRTDENGVTYTTAKERVDSLGNKIGVLKKKTDDYIMLYEYQDLVPNQNQERNLWDWDAAFKAALNDAYTKNISWIKLPVGTINIGTITNPPAYIRLSGVNMGYQQPSFSDAIPENITMVVLKNGTNGDMFDIEDANSFGWIVEDIHFIGNKYNQTTAGACFNFANLTDSTKGEMHWSFERVIIRDFKGDGFYAGQYRRAFKFNHCSIYGNDGTGVNLALSTDNTILNTGIHNNGVNGVSVNGTMNKIIACDIFRNDGAGVAFYQSGKHSFLISSGIDKNGGHGVYVDCEEIILSNVSVRTSGMKAHNTYSQIEVKRDNVFMSGITLAHESINDKDGTPNTDVAKYGINVPDNATNVVINGLTVEGTPYATALVSYPAKLKGLVNLSIGRSTPTTGKYTKGELLFSDDPDIGEYLIRACITGDGTDLGTWKGVGQIGAKNYTKAGRPTGVTSGYLYFDNDLVPSGKPLWATEDGRYVDANGLTDGKDWGTAAERLTSVPNAGFKYYDTTLKKPIYWDGSTWRDANASLVWSPAKSVALNAKVVTDNNVYQATVEGVTSTTMPSHTSGTATDGSVTWTFVKSII